MHIIIKSIIRVYKTCLKFNVEKNNRMTAYVWAISGYVKKLEGFIQSLDKETSKFLVSHFGAVDYFLLLFACFQSVFV